MKTGRGLLVAGAGLEPQDHRADQQSCSEDIVEQRIPVAFDPFDDRIE